MAPSVFFAVLASALLHAGWNAFVRATPDRTRGMAVMSMGGSSLCALGLPFVDMPPAAAWPWLGLSFLGSLATQALTAHSYKLGELSVVYPLQRGLAPIAVTGGAVLLFSEVPSLAGMGGIAAIAGGVALMAIRGIGKGGARLRTIGLALLAALLTAIYTLANAQGVRLSHSALDYALWASIPNGMAWAAIMAFRGHRPLALIRTDWGHALGSGAVTTLAFVLLLWATRQAPVAIVSALRETSILFGLLIAAFYLKERLGAVRWAAAAMILAGLALVRLG